MDVLECIPCKVRENRESYDYKRKITENAENLNSVCHRNVDCLGLLLHLLGRGFQEMYCWSSKLQEDKKQLQKRGRDFVTTTELLAVNETVIKALRDHFEYLENARGERIRELMRLEESLVNEKENVRRAKEKLDALEKENQMLKDRISSLVVGSDMHE